MMADPRPIDDDCAGRCIGLSALAHALVLAAAAMATPSLLAAARDPQPLDTSVLIQRYLSAAAERQVEAIENPGAITQGTEGPASRCGKEPGRAMGLPIALKDGRFGVHGPADNPDPRIAREAGSREAPLLEALGALVVEQARTVTAPWGHDDALGTDPVHARGNLWGDAIRVSRGNSGVAIAGQCGDACGGGGGSVALARTRDPASGETLALNQLASRR